MFHVLAWVENVGKEENAGYQHFPAFSPFPTFSKAIFLRVVKIQDCVVNS